MTEIQGLDNATWGTEKWHKEQPAKTARFDFVLFRNRGNQKLDANVEIRNIGGNKESASTDHLLVDANVFLRVNKK